jgi:hypothetical protein
MSSNKSFMFPRERLVWVFSFIIKCTSTVFNAAFKPGAFCLHPQTNTHLLCANDKPVLMPVFAYLQENQGEVMSLNL